MVVREIDGNIGGSYRNKVTVGVHSVNTSGTRDALFDVIVRHSFAIWMENFVGVFQVKGVDELFQAGREFSIRVSCAVRFTCY